MSVVCIVGDGVIVIVVVGVVLVSFESEETISLLPSMTTSIVLRFFKSLSVFLSKDGGMGTTCA